MTLSCKSNMLFIIIILMVLAGCEVTPTKTETSVQPEKKENKEVDAVVVQTQPLQQSAADTDPGQKKAGTAEQQSKNVVKPPVPAKAKSIKIYNGHFIFVGKLLKESTAAKQIKSSGDPAALALHNQALDYFQKAKQARDQGNNQQKIEALKMAKTTMFKAVRMVAGQNKVFDTKKRKDFQARYATVKALLAAHKRVRKAKKVGNEAIKTENYVESKMVEASRCFDLEDLVKAKQIIDHAFITTKMSLIKMRNGDTLVRSLNFATKKEEYHYEVKRNDTHKMLVKALLEQKFSNTDVAHLMNKHMEKALEMRTLAEQQAGRGDFQSAVHTLEQSTRQIFQAIRSAGFNIPG